MIGMVLPQGNAALLRYVEVGPEMREPIPETRVFAHFRVELQRQQVGTAAKGLMGIAFGRGKQFHARRQVEGVAVPMENGNAVQMAQRRRSEEHTSELQ